MRLKLNRLTVGCAIGSVLILSAVVAAYPSKPAASSTTVSAETADQAVVDSHVQVAPGTMPPRTRPVYETKTKVVNYTVLNPVRTTHEKVINYTVMKPVYETREKTVAYTVCTMVPEVKSKTVRYTTCKMVPETKQRTVEYTEVRYVPVDEQQPEAQ